jgi:hypothetical protein
MGKYVFVISPRFPELYADVAHDFRDDPAIEVIVDRRIAERRTATVSPPFGQRDRRHRDRRINPFSHSDLTILGCVLVRVGRP